LFRKVKEELAGLHLTQESLKNAWEGVMRTITKQDFPTALRWWFERCGQCVQTVGNYVKKSWKINTFLAITIVI
jgi:hypothetical protein